MLKELRRRVDRALFFGKVLRASGVAAPVRPSRFLEFVKSARQTKPGPHLAPMFHAAAHPDKEALVEYGERGAIVNIASVAAFDGQIGQASYSASKGGIVGLTLPVARDLAAIGVRVNTVAPGLIDTPIYGSGEGSEQFKANLQKGVLFPQRLGFQDELASMVVECITNSYMNAETIRVDGGIRMPPK